VSNEYDDTHDSAGDFYSVATSDKDSRTKTDTCAVVNHKKFNYFCQYMLHVSIVIPVLRHLNA